MSTFVIVTIKNKIKLNETPSFTILHINTPNRSPITFGHLNTVYQLYIVNIVFIFNSCSNETLNKLLLFGLFIYLHFTIACCTTN